MDLKQVFMNVISKINEYIPEFIPALITVIGIILLWTLYRNTKKKNIDILKKESRNENERRKIPVMIISVLLLVFVYTLSNILKHFELTIKIIGILFGTVIPITISVSTLFLNRNVQYKNNQFSNNGTITFNKLEITDYQDSFRRNNLFTKVHLIDEYPCISNKQYISVEYLKIYFCSDNYVLKDPDYFEAVCKSKNNCVIFDMDSRNFTQKNTNFTNNNKNLEFFFELDSSDNIFKEVLENGKNAGIIIDIKYSIEERKNHPLNIFRNAILYQDLEKNYVRLICEPTGKNTGRKYVCNISKSCL